MDLKGSTEKLKFDTRLIEMNLKNGSLSKQDLEKHTQALKDLTDLSETLEIDAVIFTGVERTGQSTVQ